MKLTLLKGFANIYLWFTATLLQVVPSTNSFISKYIFADTGFLKWLVIAMSLDLLTGIAKAYKQGGWRAITSKGLRDTVSKCVQYGAFLIITHVVTHYEVNGVVASTNLLWINKLAMEFILLIECKSVYENIVAINPHLDFISALWTKLVKYFPVKDAKKSENSK